MGGAVPALPRDWRHGDRVVGMTRLPLLTLILLVLASTGSVAAQEGDPDVPRVPSEEALEEWRILQKSPLADSERNLRLELHLLYHVAAEDEPCVDSLQVLAEDTLTLQSLERPLTEAYLGAVEVLRAKHGTWPPSRLKWARRGVARLDTARESAPEDPDVVYLQTASTLFLPFFMGRGDQAEEDLGDLARILLAGPGTMAPSVYDRMVGFVTDNLDRLDPAIRGQVAAGLQGSSMGEGDGRP